MLLGVVVGLAAAGLALTLVALPLFFFAQATEPDSGTDRPFVRTGLSLAIPAGGAVGAAAGIAAGLWWRRGGELRREDDGGWGR